MVVGVSKIGSEKLIPKITKIQELLHLFIKKKTFLFNKTKISRFSSRSFSHKMRATYEEKMKIVRCRRLGDHSEMSASLLQKKI